MIVRILGNKDSKAYKLTEQVLKANGHIIDDRKYFFCHLAVAPLMTEIIASEELNDPIYGTLIFHPSPLPYGRGASAIKWAYRRCEPITAATWFWGNSGLDTGDICEQEIVRIDYSKSPREFYERDMLPALARTLERALSMLDKGVTRRVPQVEAYASFDYKIEKAVV